MAKPSRIMKRRGRMDRIHLADESRSAPENARGVAVELRQVVVDTVRRGESVIGVEALVVVGPVQHPGPIGGVVPQASDCGAGPIRSDVLAPWRASFHDRQVARGEFAVNAQLVASVLGDPCGAPPPYACDIQFGKSHSDHQSSDGLGSLVWSADWPTGRHL